MLTINYKNIALEIKVVSYSPFIEGKYSGPAEDCYEDEPEQIEWEIEGCTFLKIVAAVDWQKMPAESRKEVESNIMTYSRFCRNELASTERSEITELILRSEKCSM